MCFKMLSTFVGLPPAKSVEEDSMILPIGIVLTEGCESHFLINEHERHFCVTVVLVPLLGSIILSHSVRQMEKNWKRPRNDDSDRRNNFCLWGGALRGDALCRQKLAINYLPQCTTYRDSLLSQFLEEKSDCNRLQLLYNLLVQMVGIVVILIVIVVTARNLVRVRDVGRVIILDFTFFLLIRIFLRIYPILVIGFHRRSTTVSLETYPLYRRTFLACYRELVCLRCFLVVVVSSSLLFYYHGFDRVYEKRVSKLKVEEPRSTNDSIRIQSESGLSSNTCDQASQTCFRESSFYLPVPGHLYRSWFLPFVVFLAFVLGSFLSISFCAPNTGPLLQSSLQPTYEPFLAKSFSRIMSNRVILQIYESTQIFAKIPKPINYD